MKLAKTNNLPLDQFINFALYDKDKGFYMKKNPFGEDGDFITAPNITRLFSEIIAIWTITFWKSIGSPKKFSWLKHIQKINSNPTIFLANEFFDPVPIKQFFKKKDAWFERYVFMNDAKKAEFKEEKIDIEKIEKYLNFEISKNQNIIEYSPDSFKYLRTICDLVQKNDGGMLIIDYGYADSKMHETLQAVNNHKYSNILENIGDSDITYNINFHSFEKFISQFKEINSIFTNQKKFLTSMGILQRAEIVSKNVAFSKKADLFYRVRRLIDENQMGELFKVMLVKNKKNKFNTGFQN